MSELLQKYRFNCTLTFSDIYLQIVVWLFVIFGSLATALALWSSTRQIYAFITVGLILVLSLPFLLFAFVTTLFNNIELTAIDPEESERSAKRAQSQARPSSASSTGSR
ncbi:MAG: hypothetical protein BRC58_04125 [Cyanobacteria bacterium QS_8_64_29]|jgi:hypothetical protein|nr:MAG: hypothetical protein BRC58_04125 [Cyanobacteria bacterium QS_8_64_29]